MVALHSLEMNNEKKLSKNIPFSGSLGQKSNLRTQDRNCQSAAALFALMSFMLGLHVHSRTRKLKGKEKNGGESLKTKQTQ